MLQQKAWMSMPLINAYSPSHLPNPMLTSFPAGHYLLWHPQSLLPLIIPVYGSIFQLFSSHITECCFSWMSITSSFILDSFKIFRILTVVEHSICNSRKRIENTHMARTLTWQPWMLIDSPLECLYRTLRNCSVHGMETAWSPGGSVSSLFYPLLTGVMPCTWNMFTQLFPKIPELFP